MWIAHCSKNISMENTLSIQKSTLLELPKIGDRLTFIYLEKCKINRDNGAISVQDKDGIVLIPAANISVLLLGPGTDVTHRAMELIGECGVTVIWVGEYGVKYYAGGRPLSNHSSLLLKQAELVSNEKKHIQVARKMYQLRFPNENVDKLTMQQLRGKEGSRVRNIYKAQAKLWNVNWSGRNYTPGDFNSSDPVNKALTAGNACLYGIVHAVCFSLGCSTGLGFVHVGHNLSFVYDIADLYKAEITIPIAFELAASNPVNIGSEVRKRIRDLVKKEHILDRIVKDIKYLLSDDSDPDDTSSNLFLWDNLSGNQQFGTLYTEEES